MNLLKATKLPFAQAPPAAYHFMVIFYGIGPASVPNTIDIRFQKVSGISVSLPENKTVKQGPISVTIPSKPTFTNLQLTRGYMVGASPLRKELEAHMLDFQICPRNVHVMLLDHQSFPIASWLFFDAYPVQWRIGDLSAEQSSLLIENMELKYSYFQPFSL